MEEAKENKKVKIKIAVVAGGDSSEYVISLQSAEQIINHINNEKYDVFTVMIREKEWYVKDADTSGLVIDKNDFSFNLNGQKVNFDAIFIAIHGTPGEDGILQAYFDLLNIPYTTSGRLTSSLTFNKYFCNTYLKASSILSAKSKLIRLSQHFEIEEIFNDLGLPCFVKPNNGGSSFGISKVKNKEGLIPAIEKAFEEDNEIIIEEFIAGTEVTCGVFKTKEKDFIFPLTEIVSKNEFFDYEAKYNGKSDEITPARISENDTKKCQKLASGIYDLLNCKGIVRIDFIMKNGVFYLLEINTVPGMTKNSIVPKQARAYGIKLEELYDLIIQDAIQRNA